MIDIIDNFITPEKCQEFYNYCASALYHYGEADTPDNPPTGMISELPFDNKWFKLFDSEISKQCKLNSPYRAYINLFLPGENPYFHIDGNQEDITFLFYPTLEWNLNEGGETKFYINNELRGILPLPNRAIIFSANILHSATSFRNKPRFTLAIKYSR